MPIELRIEKVAHGGVFVARPEGKVALVSGALEGELVLAEITDEAKNFRRAEVIEVLEPSPHRVPHFWDKAALGTGGVEFGHIELGHQRQLKSKVLAESLQRMAGLSQSVPVQAVDPTGLGYRTRIQLHSNEAGKLGVKKSRSDQVIAIDSHPLAVPEINNSGIFDQEFAKDSRIEFAVDRTGKLANSLDDENTKLQYRAGSRNFELSRGTFWQAHKSAPEVLLNAVMSELKEFTELGDVLDLYSGAGLFAANIADSFDAPVTAVESSKTAVFDGKKSASDLASLRFLRSDVLGYLRSLSKPPKTLVLDPPRSGAAGKVIQEVLRLRPAQIVYVACDPVALSRDLGQLIPAGYALGNISAYDIFPQTHHFETVVSLRLANL